MRKVGLGLGIGLRIINGTGKPVSVGTLIAPVLSGSANQTVPSVAFDIDLDGTAAVDDVISGQYSTSADFSGATAFSDTLDLSEVGALQVIITISDLTAGTYYFRAKHTRATPAAQSDWSNTLTVTMAAASGTAPLFMMLTAA